ncbi:MAG TPA: type II restriction endonuclease subunit R [Methylophilaceae bacterium]|nr:type II restriction endonuclease subunit R [Methylophilaceae bacterium]
MTAPLNERLKSVEWGEFRIGNLFDIAHYGKQRSQEDLQKNMELKYNFVMQNESNNGVIEKVPEQIGNYFNLIPGNSISAFTHLNKVYYQKEPFYSKQGSNVYTLKSNFLNEKVAKFIISAINSIIGNLEYGKNTASRLTEYKIQLPTKNGKINFDFMERFIAELEAERIAELEAYLSASGLKDTTLTVEEQQALADFESQQFEAFNVIDVFNVKNSGNILSRDIVEDSGETPYLCASAENNAVSSYISYDENYLDKGNCVFIGGKTFVVSYQEKDFFSNDSHNLILYLKDEEKRTKLNQLYLATCINKSLGHQYSWGDSISNKKIQKDKVSLPTKNKQPDFSSMETFISAIQKLVIKDVVKYADEKIAATKQVVKS